jgi:hypothetical protein
MAIEKRYLEYYDIIGLYLTPEDNIMTSEEDRIVFVSLDSNMVYFSSTENRNAFPIKIEGYQISILWWMYRLSERKCRFQEYLSEYLIPACRKYFKTQKDKRKEEDKDN